MLTTPSRTMLAATLLAAPLAASPAAQAAPAVTAKAPAATKTSVACRASYYGGGGRTANGERYNPRRLTAAHRSFPFGSKVRVTNVRTGKSVVVRINDRGPWVGKRCIDLSTAAFGKIAKHSSGAAVVRLQRIG